MKTAVDVLRPFQSLCFFLYNKTPKIEDTGSLHRLLRTDLFEIITEPYNWRPTWLVEYATLQAEFYQWKNTPQKFLFCQKVNLANGTTNGTRAGLCNCCCCSLTCWPCCCVCRPAGVLCCCSAGVLRCCCSAGALPFCCGCYIALVCTLLCCVLLRIAALRVNFLCCSWLLPSCMLICWLLRGV